MIIGPVDVTEMVAWISAIPFEEWPQQRRLADGKIRPAMVTDLKWHDFWWYAAPLMGAGAYQPMLSVVMPGHSIEPHVDKQPPYWRHRVHCPLVSNAESRFTVGGEAVVMVPGNAYRVDTTVEHSVANNGDTPRVHFIFDVRQ